MSLLVDTHCHLDFDVFDTDRAQVLRNARESGIERVVVPGIDVTSSRRAVELAAANLMVFAAVGVHPNDCAGWGDQAVPDLRFLLHEPGVVAVGEIGLDYYRDYTPHEKQAEILTAQLDLAAEVGLPVILHCRQAANDLYAIINAWVETLGKGLSPLARQPGVLHAFEGTFEEAQRWNAMGFYLGIGGPVTYHNAAEKHELVRRVPLEWIVLETDAPFLSPQPHRGRRNEPANIKLVAEAVASLKKIPVDRVSFVTGGNAASLFRWSY